MQGCKKHDYFSLSSLNIPFSNTAITVMNHLHLCTTHSVGKSQKKSHLSTLRGVKTGAPLMLLGHQLENSAFCKITK